MPSKKYNRTKGHNFEREVARDFREIGYTGARRNLEYNQGDTGIDIANTGIFRVQCKNKKKYVSINTIDEIDISNGGFPLLITKANGKEPIAVIRWSDLKEILKEGLF